MLAWLARKLATMVAGYAIGSAATSMKSTYGNMKAYEEFKDLLAHAQENRPSDCVEGKVTRICPQSSVLVGMYDRRAGGTGTLHIYTFVGFGDKMILIQFYDTTQKVFFWTYNAKWEPLDFRSRT